MKICYLVSAHEQNAANSYMDWAENFGVHAGLHGQEDRAGIIIMKIFDKCHCFEAE